MKRRRFIGTTLAGLAGAGAAWPRFSWGFDARHNHAHKEIKVVRTVTRGKTVYEV